MKLSRRLLPAAATVAMAASALSTGTPTGEMSDRYDTNNEGPSRRRRRGGETTTTSSSPASAPHVRHHGGGGGGRHAAALPSPPIGTVEGPDGGDPSRRLAQAGGKRRRARSRRRSTGTAKEGEKEEAGSRSRFYDWESFSDDDKRSLGKMLEQLDTVSGSVDWEALKDRFALASLSGSSSDVVEHVDNDDGDGDGDDIDDNGVDDIILGGEETDDGDDDSVSRDVIIGDDDGDDDGGEFTADFGDLDLERGENIIGAGEEGRRRRRLADDAMPRPQERVTKKRRRRRKKNKRGGAHAHQGEKVPKRHSNDDRSGGGKTAKRNSGGGKTSKRSKSPKKGRGGGDGGGGGGSIGSGISFDESYTDSAGKVDIFIVDDEEDCVEEEDDDGDDHDNDYDDDYDDDDYEYESSSARYTKSSKSDDKSSKSSKASKSGKSSKSPSYSSSKPSSSSSSSTSNSSSKKSKGGKGKAPSCSPASYEPTAYTKPSAPSGPSAPSARPPTGPNAPTVPSEPSFDEYTYSRGNCPGPGSTGLGCAPTNLRFLCDKYDPESRGSFSACLEACKPSFCCIHDALSPPEPNSNYLAPNCNDDENCADYAYCYIVWWKLHDTIGPALYLRIEQDDDFYDMDADDIQGDKTGDPFFQELILHHFDDVQQIIDDGTDENGDFEATTIFDDPAYWETDI